MHRFDCISKSFSLGTDNVQPKRFAFFFCFLSKKCFSTLLSSSQQLFLIQFLILNFFFFCFFHSVFKHSFGHTKCCKVFCRYFYDMFQFLWFLLYFGPKEREGCGRPCAEGTILHDQSLECRKEKKEKNSEKKKERNKSDNLPLWPFIPIRQKKI